MKHHSYDETVHRPPRVAVGFCSVPGSRRGAKSATSNASGERIVACTDAFGLEGQVCVGVVRGYGLEAVKAAEVAAGALWKGLEDARSESARKSGKILSETIDSAWSRRSDRALRWAISNAASVMAESKEFDPVCSGATMSLVLVRGTLVTVAHVGASRVVMGHSASILAVGTSTSGLSLPPLARSRRRLQQSLRETLTRPPIAATKFALRRRKDGLASLRNQSDDEQVNSSLLSFPGWPAVPPGIERTLQYPDITYPDRQKLRAEGAKYASGLSQLRNTSAASSSSSSLPQSQTLSASLPHKKHHNHSLQHNLDNLHRLHTKKHTPNPLSLVPPRFVSQTIKKTHRPPISPLHWRKEHEEEHKKTEPFVEEKPPKDVEFLEDVDENPPKDINFLEEVDEKRPKDIDFLEEVDGKPPKDIGFVEENDEPLPKDIDFLEEEVDNPVPKDIDFVEEENRPKDVDFVRLEEHEERMLEDDRVEVGSKPPGARDPCVCVPLTVDHRPDRPDEMRRLGSSGARVERLRYADGSLGSVPRVFRPTGDGPGLAVSRILGYTEANALGVSAEPDVTVNRIGRRDRFIVLGTEGIWQYLSSAQVVSIVQTTLDGVLDGGSLRHAMSPPQKPTTNFFAREPIPRLASEAEPPPGLSHGALPPKHTPLLLSADSLPMSGSLGCDTVLKDDFLQQTDPDQLVPPSPKAASVSTTASSLPNTPKTQNSSKSLKKRRKKRKPKKSIPLPAPPSSTADLVERLLAPDVLQRRSQAKRAAARAAAEAVVAAAIRAADTTSQRDAREDLSACVLFFDHPITPSTA